MRIGIITPAPPRSRYGNRVTALRWFRILKQLGHQVLIAQAYRGEPYDLMVALHAKRSYRAVRNFRRLHPEAPLIVALTGTDLYGDLRHSHAAKQSLDLATRLIVLQPKALDELQPNLHSKMRVIYQSVGSLSRKASQYQNLGFSPGRRTFDVCVIGHLRAVKDPFRAALAARRLPASSRIRILHIGSAMTGAMKARAQREMTVNPRYHWLGEQPQWRVRRLLEQSRLCVLSSRMEGGANVLSEAIVASVPILASRIPGTIGILGEDYPGYFKVGATTELMRLLMQAETDREFRVELKAWGEQLIPLFNPAREQAAWRELIGELWPS